MDGTFLRPGTVKICSIREVAHAEYVVAAGADLFGLNFAVSRRQVTLEMAREIVAEARTLAGLHPLLSVGVFVDQSADEINRIAESVGLDLVQLHGSEPPGFADQIERPVLRVFRTRPGLTMHEIDEHLATRSNRIVAALIEGYRAGHAGGTGAIADWTFATKVVNRYPVMLAGGLTPESVARAIATVRPLGVDVSSGVEVEGHKDRQRIVSFVREARSGFAGLTTQSSESSRPDPVSTSS